MENYVKDVFANSFDLPEKERMKKLSQVFSYLGNQNNPPDIILRNSDAIEIKKIESANSGLALNSSYPKSKLFIDDPLLSDDGRNCEEWSVKDLIYIVGHVNDLNVKYLWFVYGDCFCARRETYEKIKKKIKSGILEIPNVEFADTNELGGVKKVDPLGVTNLRIRGMWHIENPHKIFSYLKMYDSKAKFQIMCLMLTDKFNSFPIKDINALQNIKNKNYTLENVQIQNPNNPAELLDSTLITFKSY